MAPTSAPRGALRHEKVFYTKEWTEDIDRCFLRGLAEQTMTGNPVNLGANKAAIRSAMHRVNKVFGKTFDYATCLERFGKLRKRYDVYTWIINLPGVTNDPTTYEVVCKDEDWDFICRGDPLAMAYMKKGESDFHTLKYIFEERDPVILRDDAGNEIIQISSDHSGQTSQAGDRDDDNISNVFCNELAWYTSDTDNEASWNSSYHGSHQSSNVNANFERKKKDRNQASSSHGHNTSGPSSVTSSSPFKKH